MVATLSYTHTQAHTHTVNALYYADLWKVNLITLVIPDQRVFSLVKNPSGKEKKGWKTWQQIKKWFHEGGMRDGPIHQNGSRVWTCCHAWCQARCQAVQCLSTMPTPWGCVFVTRTERSLGLTALNHTPLPTHCLSLATKQPAAEKPLEKVLVKSTGLFQVVYITFFYSNWLCDIWCCYDTSPALESTPVSKWLYTEWMIPSKCILEFCTNTFPMLSKQCRPLSRCIVYAFCALVAEQRETSERERNWERQFSFPGDISSVNSACRFSILSAFLFKCRTDS